MPAGILARGLVLKMVTDGDCKGITGIVPVDLFFLQPEDVLQHFPHLLFFRIAVTGDRLLDLLWRILRDGNPCVHRGCDCHTLCPTKLQHALDILAKEGRFDGKILGRVTADQLLDLLMDKLQPFIVVPADRQTQYPHFDQA